MVDKVDMVDIDMANVKKILDLYEKYGNNDYIGEHITQTEHALQCAECAETDPRIAIYDDYIKNCVIVAALLHDIGHLVGMEKGEMEMKNINTLDGNSNCISLGIVGHEGIGSAFLKDCGMPYLICELVASHVQAKRYLCTTSRYYYDKLSDASKETMKIQGGLMSPQELRDFKTSILPELKIYLREFDDLGKKIDIINTTTPNSIEKYKKQIELALIHGKVF
jgi:predicted HD phosphohydrolase